jgi:GAF domain-containing protein
VVILGAGFEASIMISSPLTNNSLLLTTGEFQIPVCVGDMPSYSYRVPIDTITEVVTAYLETRPDIPGVILMNEQEFHSVIPRSMIFERLAHMYGVELFLRKPILELQKSLQTRMYTISSNMRVQDAVRIALERPFQDIYDPLAILYDTGEIRLLEMHVLLAAQSYALQNIHNLMSSLAQLKRIVEIGSPLEEILGCSLDSLRKVVPFHQVMIHVKDAYFCQLPGRHSVIRLLDDQLAQDTVVRTVLNIRQSLHVEDVRMVPAWEDFTLLHGIRSWIGIPLLNSTGILGLLSLMRHSNSPFNKDEMNMSKAFAELIAIALHEAAEMELKRKNGENNTFDRKFSSQFEYAME